MKELTEEDNFELPMTPMIDIVFQLLIFFLLATTIQNEELDVSVKIPQGQHGNPAGQGAARRLNISIRKDGTYTYSGQVVTWDELRKKVLDASAGNAKPVVSLRVDKEAQVNGVAKIIQLCQEGKLENVNWQFVKDR